MASRSESELCTTLHLRSHALELRVIVQRILITSGGQERSAVGQHLESGERTECRRLLTVSLPNSFEGIYMYMCIYMTCFRSIYRDRGMGGQRVEED